MQITNNSPAPQGVNTLTGLVFIKPGQTRDLELNDEQRKAVGRLEFLSIDGEAPKVSSGSGRDANGDTPEMAQMRKMFDGAYRRQGDELKSVVGDRDKLKGDLEAANASIAELNKQLDDAKKQVDELTKQLPETDIDKMTVPELRAFLAYRDLPFDSRKDKKDDLVAAAKKASA